MKPNRCWPGSKGNTDDHPIVEFNAPKHIYKFTTDDNIRMLFGELQQGEYHLPFVNLVKKYHDRIVVPFMGVQLKNRGGGYSTPKWNVVRKSQYEEANGRYHLWGGMNGEIILHESWGDIVVHATMAQRGSPDQKILFAMLADEVPEAAASLAGELHAPGKVIYWRVGPSPQPGKLKVVLARKCERESKFDNLVSFSSHYPGDAERKEDVRSAVQKINNLVGCVPE